MAEQLLFGAADRIIETLGSLVAKEFRLLWGVGDEIESLRNTVSAIKAVLLDAEEKQAAGNHAVGDWLVKLNDAIYDADDLPDAISTEALRREVRTLGKKAKQVRIFFSESNQLAFRLGMGLNIKAIGKRLDAIDAERGRFHLEERHVETRVGCRERDNTHSLVRAEAVIGLSRFAIGSTALLNRSHQDLFANPYTTIPNERGVGEREDGLHCWVL
ncbi:hypothetical protein FH972_019628 [Carpinus fangiana]|uniref:Disease resistance N-terminal domain-containing protein n=1 Tax=Carpinus fangiana TaxID=176857 RepID=A0A5N6RV35_9ROSI|nr:hypothetical protein FH972_019628 [Carpinus fangiana]KAE8124773.1 hypothetical protein FH972_019628 [Carpinus fangiana]KAE8124774.1 hypothetical protein FH972_019628 [Carpinus fangiana]